MPRTRTSTRRRKQRRHLHVANNFRRDKYNYWMRMKFKRRWIGTSYPYPRVRLFPKLWRDLRLREQLCDCVVESQDGKCFRAHRIILATAGEYFQGVFTSSLSKSQRRLVLPFPSQVVEALIEYSYTGDIYLTDFIVEQILPAADYTGMVGLVDHCTKYLYKHMTSSNAWGIHEFGKAYSCMWLAREAKAFVLRNFKEFVTDGVEFVTLSFYDLMELARNDYLNIRSENVLVEAIDKWIMFDYEVRKTHVNDLFMCVRYATMDPLYIFPKINSLPYKNDIPSKLVQLALSAIKNRIDNDNSLVETSNSYMCRPRLPHFVLFAAGGWSSGAPTNLLETYDTRSNRWIYSRCDEPSPRSYHGLVSVNNILYIIGGFDGVVHFNTVRSFNPITKQWKDKANMTVPRCYVCCVELGGDIYAIGGYNGRSRMKSVEKYNISHNQWEIIQPMNKRRSDAGAVAVGQQIYVAGGFNGSDVLSSVEVYDLTTKKWSLIEHMKSPRSGLSLCHFRGYVYAIGGFSGNLRLASSERLSTMRSSVEKWIEDVPPMQSSRSNFSCCVLEDNIIVIGGFNGDSTTAMTEMFDGQKWSQLCPMNMNRSALAVSICHGLPNTIEYSLLHEMGGGRMSAMG